MRFKLVAALLALLPAPALADITVTYAAKDKTLTIEVEDHGNARISFDGKLGLIRRDGIDYAIARDANGAYRVARVDALLAFLRTNVPGAKLPKLGAGERRDVVLMQGPSLTLAGYTGTTWYIAPAKTGVAAFANGVVPGNAIQVVLSPDPALAPIGGLLKHLADMAAPVILSMLGDTNISERADELFAKGTPILMGKALTLASARTDEIPDDHFALPGPMVSTAEFFAAFDRPATAEALPPAP